MKTRKSITYLFRGLALGALMIAGTGIYFGTTSSGAGDDPSSRGNQVGIAYPSSENSQGLQASAYCIQRDEAEEMAYDELSRNFIGIPSPATKITGRFLSGEDLRFMIHYWGRFLSDEDLRFMIQYLNELKEDEAINPTLNDQDRETVG
jgi:hypothetical protein